MNFFGINQIGKGRSALSVPLLATRRRRVEREERREERREKTFD